MATSAQWYPDMRRSRYNQVAILLHWLIAAAILYNLTSGLLRPVLPRGFFIFHISSGITILVLSVLRVVWRLMHKPPAFLPMKPWEARLAHIVHFLLYAAILLLPLSGWALVSANPPSGSPGAAYAAAERAKTQPAPVLGAAPQRPRGPTMIWGVVKLPLIANINEIGRTPEGIPRQRTLHERFEGLHLIGGYVMLLLLVLHIGGALKHQFVDDEPELQRMGVGRRRR